MTREEIAAELRWLFRDSRGELGLKSNFGGVVARIEGGGPGSDAHHVDMRRIEAATRARHISKVLDALPKTHFTVLFAAFAWDADHKLLWVMRETPEAVEEYGKSRSTRLMRDWLERLCVAARNEANYERRRVFARIHAAAEKLLREALNAYARQQNRERSDRLFGEGARGHGGN